MLGEASEMPLKEKRWCDVSTACWRDVGPVGRPTPRTRIEIQLLLPSGRKSPDDVHLDEVLTRNTQRETDSLKKANLIGHY